MFIHLNLIKPREITNPRIYMYEISETAAEKWKIAVDDPDCQIIALTGAGISAESGIPTFRGEDGYWKIGSLNYTPMEMATLERFRDYPFCKFQTCKFVNFKKCICKFPNLFFL